MSNLKVYPNPSSSTVTVESKSVKSILIFSINGLLVQSETSNHFSVERLPIGMYLMSVITDEGRETFRFEKE